MLPKEIKGKERNAFPKPKYKIFSLHILICGLMIQGIFLLLMMIILMITLRNT